MARRRTCRKQSRHRWSPQKLPTLSRGPWRLPSARSSDRAESLERIHETCHAAGSCEEATQKMVAVAAAPFVEDLGRVERPGHLLKPRDPALEHGMTATEILLRVGGPLVEGKAIFCGREVEQTQGNNGGCGLGHRSSIPSRGLIVPKCARHPQNRASPC